MKAVPTRSHTCVGHDDRSETPQNVWDSEDAKHRRVQVKNDDAGQDLSFLKK